MIIDLLKLIRSIKEPLQLQTDKLKEINDKIDNLIEYLNSETRPEIQYIDELKNELQRIGALIEISKIFDANSNYYYERDLSKYLLNKYIAISSKIQGYATESTKKEIEDFLNMTEKHKDVYPFYPIFLNILGVYFQLYESDLKTAQNLYKSSVDCLEKINSSNFKSITTINYKRAKDLFTNNILDAMIRSPSPKKQIKEIHLLKKRIYDSEETISTESSLDIAEFHIRLGESKTAKDILSSVRKSNVKDIEYYYPQIYRIEAIMAFQKGDLSSAFDYAIKSFKFCFKKGKPLSKKLNIVSLLPIINKLSSEISFKDRITIFKEKGFVNFVTNVVETNDRNLALEHLKKVAELSVKLWKTLKKEKRELNHIYFSGLFHDIGKISIPWFTLSKPTKLDSIDKEILKYHTLEGFKLLNLLGLSNEARVARDHHERIDGSGYPYGRKRIKKDTEIVAIADIFTAASSSNRNYKNPKTSKIILQEIEKDVKHKKFHKDIYDAIMYLKT